ncbi:hypothetical protein PILCRDRAFT_507949 [Piloderma croceum F 1598]|uniref:Uncharacterized protein n=1 Tax=Piloderma croceum (strain F 1598) TaxID=765440 RepID=A0A0C3BVD4_PILCF|nr:hypothetical protein PILCRDRAFT_507949 [Piloderma croceum F 1598]
MLPHTIMFHNANYTNASQSHFSNVGRDQHNEYREQLIQTINVNIPDTASQETFRCVLGSICHVPPPSSSAVIITSHHNRSPCDVASNLIVEIKRLLVDLMKFSVDYRYLQDLLNRLHQTLFLTGLGIQAYEDTPLGPNLAAAIIPLVEQCQGIL